MRDAGLISDEVSCGYGRSDVKMDEIPSEKCYDVDTFLRLWSHRLRPKKKTQLGNRQ